MNPPLDSDTARKIQTALLSGPKLPDLRRSLASAAMPTVPTAQTAADALEERTAVRAVIAELHDAPADVPLPMPDFRGVPLRLAVDEWEYVGSGVWSPRRSHFQAGRLDPDAAVALSAVALLAAACRFGGLF